MPPRRTRNERESPLNPEVIVDAALALIDREGSTALSMRRVGAELGVEAMALYHHFENKDALLDAMMRQGTSGDLPELTGHWRADLSALTNAVRAQLSAHPGLLPLRWERRKVSQEALAVLELERAIVRNARFSKGLAQNAHRLLGSYVVGFVVAHAAAGASDGRGPKAAEWAREFDAGLELLLDGIAARLLREGRQT
jgi:AcrR family transcriptional regulator